METLSLAPNQSRGERYEALLPQVASLMAAEPDSIANMANMAAALKEAFEWLWVGFYRVEGDELVLGPFQGSLACTRIAKGKGVCGTCWADEKAIVVPNVHEYPGHIACSALSNSEIVVPVMGQGGLIAVLDIDSAQLNDFSALDVDYLSQLVALLV